MIVEQYLKQVFNNMELKHTFNDRPKKSKVICEYGDELELVRWVTAMNNSTSKQKYPLIWVSSEKYYKHAGFIKAKVRFILIQDSLYSWLNAERYKKEFRETLTPLCDMVEDTLKKSLTINVVGSGVNRFTRSDAPLWSISDKFERPSNGSASTDIVDAMTLDCEIEININCLKI